jgi:argininosuccinate synthase
MSIVLAFSGGLDTSFCVPYLIEELGLPVITVTVNTGGIDQVEAARIKERALELGASQHFTVDARPALFNDLISYLIKGNVLRGDVYPLCVGPERVTQAQKVIEIAREVGAQYVAHGSTGAGNDQVRFDVALRQLAGDLEILTPIRKLGLTREQASAFLEVRGFKIEKKTTTYSINRGLWGTTIGGGETHDPALPLPSEAYPHTVSPQDAPDEPLTLTIGFEKGIPITIDGAKFSPVALIETLEEVGAQYGIGRGMHLGDTILGIKGRVAFEAPAAAILIPAHRELEKLVLTRWQKFQKDQLADFYGMLLHEGQYFDPVMRDVEAFIDSSQDVVTGDVTISLYKGSMTVQGCTSPFSMLNEGVATYGETNTLWDGRDAEGFSKIYGLQGFLAARASSNAQSHLHQSHA